jgi:hypothetical protein
LSTDDNTHHAANAAGTEPGLIAVAIATAEVLHLPRRRRWWRPGRGRQWPRRRRLGRWRLRKLRKGGPCRGSGLRTWRAGPAAPDAAPANASQAASWTQPGYSHTRRFQFAANHARFLHSHP